MPSSSSLLGAMEQINKALPAAASLSLGAVPLATAVVAVLLARWLLARARALPVPTIEVELSPGESSSTCVKQLY